MWNKKICAWLLRRYPSVRISEKNPRAVLVLGGDGTILEAAQRYQRGRHIMLGLNLGHTGFLAAVRKQKNFFQALDKFLKGKYSIIKRMMVHVDVIRKGKKVFSADSLNEISVQSLLGMVEMDVLIDNHLVQHIRGTGVLVATATGSTAYNLSAHGPIVMPDIRCLVVTEIMDHNIPTPSIVVKRNREITLNIKHFRERKLLTITSTGKGADVVVTADGEKLFPLEIGDMLTIRRAPGLITFVEFERSYFFTSLEEKFAFK